MFKGHYLNTVQSDEMSYSSKHMLTLKTILYCLVNLLLRRNVYLLNSGSDWKLC